MLDFASVLLVGKIERHRPIKRERRPDITGLEALNKISRPAPSGVGEGLRGKIRGDARRDQFHCSFKVKPIKFRGRVSGEAQRSLATPSLLPFPSLPPISASLSLAHHTSYKHETTTATGAGRPGRGEISNRITLRYNCLLAGYRCRSTPTVLAPSFNADI